MLIKRIGAKRLNNEINEELINQKQRIITNKKNRNAYYTFNN